LKVGTTKQLVLADHRACRLGRSAIWTKDGRSFVIVGKGSSQPTLDPCGDHQDGGVMPCRTLYVCM